MRIAALTVAALASSTVAHSQPGMTPVAAPTPAASVADRPWDISVDLSWRRLRLKQHENGSALPEEPLDRTTVFSLGLSAHYRIKRVFQVGVLLVAGGARVPPLTGGGVMIDLRYRLGFAVERKWNPYVHVAFGVMSLAPKDDANDEEKAGRGAIRGGIGVEYRWTERWGLHTELLLEAIGKNEEIMFWRGGDVWRYAENPLRGFGLNVGGAFYF